jgi:hypothetical protein
MATRRPSNRDRAAVSDQRAVARHKLETEVRETDRNNARHPSRVHPPRGPESLGG